MQRTRKRASYHDGDLRPVLVEAAAELVRTKGVDGVGMREVARHAGVSPGAPYHHFRDRAALYAAVATRGFELLKAELQVAANRSPPSSEPLKRILVAYVQFSHTHRGYFQLMFRPELYAAEENLSVRDAGDKAFGVLCDAVTSASPSTSATMSVLLWALGHGLASLRADGALARRAQVLGRSQDELVREVCETFERLIRADGATDSHTMTHATDVAVRQQRGQPR